MDCIDDQEYARRSMFIGEFFNGARGVWRDPRATGRHVAIVCTNEADAVTRNRVGGTDLALLRTAEHDALVVPGRFAVRSDRQDVIEQLGDDIREIPDPFCVGDGDDDGTVDGPVVQHPQASVPPAGDGPHAVEYVNFTSTRNSSLQRVLHVLDLLAQFSGADGRMGYWENDAYYPPITAVHGLGAAQKFKPARPYDASATLPEPTPATEPGRRIDVLDTGLPASDLAWSTPNILGFPNDPSDPLFKPGNPNVLDWAGGHGAFIAGVCHQVDPSAKIRVHNVNAGAGLVSEDVVVHKLAVLSNASPKPSVVVLSFGGYASNVGFASDDRWPSMPILQGAISKFLKACPDAVIVASAGNENTSVECFPAALSVTFPDQVIAVGACKTDDKKTDFSNHGRWVTATALGVGIRSVFVTGKEDPAVDSTPDSFANFAVGAGTSFAAPIVAGLLTRSNDPTAKAAWITAKALGLPVSFGNGGVSHV